MTHFFVNVQFLDALSCLEVIVALLVFHFRVGIR